jgi:HSP20 family molecular chaperone IbpA
MLSCRPAISNLKLPATTLRITKPSVPRSYHQTSKMAFFPRMTTGDFTPLFRLLDDYDAHRSTASRPNGISSLRSFVPKFDVKEVKDAYHLAGELPGINQKDVNIEFTDSHTLVIKGRAQREYSASSDGDSENQAQVEPADETSSTKSLRATVEDEDAPASPQEVSKSTPTEVTKETTPKTKGYKYWISERSVGEFHRTFSFPTRVDQDAVKASLKDGILSIVVPKAAAPISKRITVE